MIWPGTYASLNPVCQQGGKVAGDLLEVLAEKLIMSGQNLIHMIGELKRNAVVNDFSALNHNIACQDGMHDKEIAALDAKLSMLRDELRNLSTQ